MKKRFLSFVFAVVLVISLMPTVSKASAAGTVVTTAEDLQTALNSGGEIVLGADIGTKSSLSVTESSVLNLNGYKLTVITSAPLGIKIELGKTFTVTDSKYTDAAPGNGKLYVNGYYTGIRTTGATLIIEKGVVEAIGQWNVGIGGRDVIGYYDGGTVTINGGKVSATGGCPGVFGGAGIGGMGVVGSSAGGNGGTITINGGTVTATGGDYAAGIGGGGTAGSSGGGGNGGTIAINGGTVTATGGGYAAGIGGGGGGNGGTVNISGGIVKATGGSKAYDIGSGNYSNDGGSLTVTGGTLKLAKNGTNVAPPSFKSCTVEGSGAGKYVGTYDATGNLINLKPVSATPTASKVLVNGSKVSFQAYNINGSNYFKLRDLAESINDTEKQFEVGYDSSKNAITITSGTKYTSVGGELSISNSTARTSASVSSAIVYLNGSKISLTAYNIGGNNYFKLRDVASSLNFGTTYDSSTGTIGIDTTKGYAA